ncbi:lysine exporter protein [Acidiphilium multivorum AIU301]|nr:lysine exporter protein [Acidiphilium multivorum AIU301]
MGVLSVYIVTVITMIAVPGPVVILVTGAGLSGGWARAFRTIIGTNAASLVMIALSALIIKGIFDVNQTIFDILKLFGAIYIGYVGLSIIREAYHSDLVDMAFSKKLGGIRRGFSLAISNPKDIIFFSSFFPQFIDVTSNKNASLGILTVVWILLDFTTLMTVYFTISRVARPSSNAVMLKIAGSLLVLIAIIGATVSIAALLGDASLSSRL